MIRESKRREINSKNGRKGGNPSLLGAPVSPSRESLLQNSVNRLSNRPDKAKPDPEPDPELERLILDKSSPEDTAAEKRPPRPRDLASDHFAAKSLELTGSPYVAEAADFVMLAKLRKAFGTPAREKPPGWDDATDHYFSSPLGQYSLADLANPKRYAVFKNSALDQFNKPIHHANRSNGNGQREFESKGETLIRKQKEAGQRARELLRGATGNGTGSDDSAREDHPVRPRLVGSE
jgi:hypothetical protein